MQQSYCIQQAHLKQICYCSVKIIYSPHLSSDRVTYDHYIAGLHVNDHLDPLAYDHVHGHHLSHIPSFHGASIFKNPATNRKKKIQLNKN